MVLIEIPPNPNCPGVETRLFHDVAPPQRVSRVRLERHPGHPAWYEVTGWTTSGTPCPAVAQKVDDSGEGVAVLVYGGDAGLRFKSARHPVSWRLDDAAQWGEPFLLVADASDVRLIAGSVVHG